jgi:hypothetical protein
MTERHTPSAAVSGQGAVRTWKRTPVCSGTGRAVFAVVITGGVTFPFKTYMTPGRRFCCPSCLRTVKTEIGGTRGHWVYVFTEHPRQGVTRGQWRSWLERRAA